MNVKRKHREEAEASQPEPEELPEEPDEAPVEELSGEMLDQANLEAFFGIYKISQREQEIIHLVIQGKKSDEIADLFYISKHTVKNHIYSIYRKVGVKNRVELTNFIHDFNPAEHSPVGDI